MSSNDPLNPVERLSKRNLLGDSLKTFLYSLSQGMAASASAPGRRGSRLGVAAALGAPLQLQQMEEDRRRQEQDRQLRIQQVREQMAQADQQKKMQLIALLTGRPTAATGVQGEVPTMGSPNPVGLNQESTDIANQAAPPQPVMSGPNQTPRFASNPTIDVGGIGVTPPNQADVQAQESAKRLADVQDFIAKQRGAQQAERDFAPPPAPRAPINVPGRGLMQLGPDGTPQFIPGTKPPKPEVAPVHVSSYTNQQGKHVDVFRGPDGKVSEVIGQGVKEPSISSNTNSERSYNARNTELEKVAGPIADGIQRVGRLVDTLNNGSPIADSVTAPELMVVMAGGQGSGVRITQSEINNIVGGQSKWEAMKAALNQWNTNPDAANKILAPMRGQIKALVDKVNGKLVAKQSIVEAARQKLVDSEDPKEHKQIVADAKKALSAVDQGSSSTGFSVEVNGKTFTFPTQGALTAFKKEMKIP